MCKVLVPWFFQVERKKFFSTSSQSLELPYARARARPEQYSKHCKGQGKWNGTDDDALPTG